MTISKNNQISYSVFIATRLLQCNNVTSCENKNVANK